MHTKLCQSKPRGRHFFCREATRREALFMHIFITRGGMQGTAERKAMGEKRAREQASGKAEVEVEAYHNTTS